MNFQDEIFWIGLNLRRSKPPDNGLIEKGEENLSVKGNVLSCMNIVNIVKL